MGYLPKSTTLALLTAGVLGFAGASMPFASQQNNGTLGLRDNNLNAPRAGAQPAHKPLDVTSPSTNSNQTPAPVNPTNTSPDWETPTFGTFAFIASACLTAMVVKCSKYLYDGRQDTPDNPDLRGAIIHADLVNVLPPNENVLSRDKNLALSTIYREALSTKDGITFSSTPVAKTNLLDHLEANRAILSKYDPNSLPSSTTINRQDSDSPQLSRSLSSVSV